jgi:3-keto-5-aminohexanoate cleavage enzyme
MALNPGPMTFRGKGGSSSSVYVASFDDSLRAAELFRERGIKPQVFLYHPGHLDILDFLISHDALDKPYFVQLVFGQQSGIPADPSGVLFMVKSLPEDCLFQTCALGLPELHVNMLSLLLGGHVRTGMEDSLLYRRSEPAESNEQLVKRIVRMAEDLGRRIATAEETREMLGISPKTRRHLNVV